jgi:hypothetical protein
MELIRGSGNEKAAAGKGLSRVGGGRVGPEKHALPSAVAEQNEIPLGQVTRRPRPTVGPRLSAGQTGRRPEGPLGAIGSSLTAVSDGDVHRFGLLLREPQ